jgi:hypothetical protein
VLDELKTFFNQLDMLKSSFKPWTSKLKKILKMEVVNLAWKRGVIYWNYNYKKIVSKEIDSFTGSEPGNVSESIYQQYQHVRVSSQTYIR